MFFFYCATWTGPLYFLNPAFTQGMCTLFYLLWCSRRYTQRGFEIVCLLDYVCSNEEEEGSCAAERQGAWGHATACVRPLVLALVDVFLFQENTASCTSVCVSLYVWPWNTAPRALPTFPAIARCSFEAGHKSKVQQSHDDGGTCISPLGLGGHATAGRRRLPCLCQPRKPGLGLWRVPVAPRPGHPIRVSDSSSGRASRSATQPHPWAHVSLLYYPHPSQPTHTTGSRQARSRAGPGASFLVPV